MAITALVDVDPVFAEVAKALFGADVDPRELWDLSKNIDAADVHVPAASTAPPKKKHSKTGGLLLMGTAAEADASVHAVKGAMNAVKAGGALKSLGGPVGRAALQTANLGVGLVAAHQLLKKPKPPVPPTAVAKAFKLRLLRPIKQVMTEEQHAAHVKSLTEGTKNGTRIVSGMTAVAGLSVGHHLGHKAGVKETAIAKGVLQPVNGVKAVNAGTLSLGLGRHGRAIGGKTPAPTLSLKPTALPKGNVIVAKAKPKLKHVPRENGKIIANAAVGKSLTWTGVISKVDTDKRTVFGWCSLSEVDGRPVYDLQDDYVPIEEVEKSAYRYVIDSRKGGDMHKRVSKADEVVHTADLIESFVVTPDKLQQMGLASNALPLGWWIGMKVNDDAQWAMVKSGERKGFSIHGTGTRKEMAA